MPSIKIIKRMIDPITFVERVCLEFIPRIEDSVLDDQLAGSMNYLAPKRHPIPPPPLLDPNYRPPTPPKMRGKSDNPNGPRKSLTSPAGCRNSFTSPGVGRRNSLTKKGADGPEAPSDMLNPQRRPSKTLDSALGMIGEDCQLSNSSLESALSALNNSLPKLDVKSVQFADEVELNHYSRMSNSILDEIFYGSEDLANFRYEAFMEEAGLDINEFD